MMNTPTQQQLIDNSLHYLQQALSEHVDLNNLEELAALDARFGRENNDVFSFVVGTAAHGNYLYVKDYLSKQFNPLTATDEFLNAWLNSYGITRKPASPATGDVLFSGVENTVIDVGTALQHDGIIYHTLYDVTISANGFAKIDVAATSGGADTDLEMGVKLSLVNPVAGVDSEATVDENGLEGGADAETEAQVKYRLKHRIQNPPLGGAPHDYARWAMQVPGVIRAWGLRAPAGGGTAGVVIMGDGTHNHGIPEEETKQAVIEYIGDEDRGPADELFVFIPVPVFVDIQIKITPDNTRNRTAAELELRDLFYRESIPGGVTGYKPIPHTHLSEAISVSSGEYDHQIISPAITAGGAISVGQYEVSVLRNVEFVT